MNIRSFAGASATNPLIFSKSYRRCFSAAVAIDLFLRPQAPSGAFSRASGSCALANYRRSNLGFFVFSHALVLPLT
jgi:hypothetical protein